jgi:hypothetical protein
MLYPIQLEKIGEGRRLSGFWGKRKVWRWNDPDDKGYCGTTGL